MAQVIPDVSPSDLIHDSERRVLEALKTLPDAYVVMHSYPWLRPDWDLPDGILREGEADFIILHPRRGLLVVEVKGGDCQLDGRIWTRSGREIRDPFDQARRSKYALIKAVEDRTRGAVRPDMYTHGEVVIFPHHTYRGSLPLNTDRRTIIDARGLEDIEQRLLEAFDAWGGRRGPPPELLERLKNALLPSLRLVRCAGVDISAEAARMMQLTADQHDVLRGLVESRRVLVQGVAGSGKTLLALEYAITLAEAGKKVLLLCYNRNLAEWLAERLQAEPRMLAASGAVEASNFHKYALGLARLARVEFSVPKANASAFWDNEAALLLEQAIEVLRGTPEQPRFDAVVVDEGQDFSPDWWITVDELSGGPKGSLYVFLDMDQSLRRTGGPPPVAFQTKLRLDVNCRNTRQISLSAAGIARVSLRVPSSAADGERPVVRRPVNANEGVALMSAEVRTLLRDGLLKPAQIAILGPASLEHGSARGLQAIDGVPLVGDAAAWRRGDGLLVSTARAFKGLEADVVILYDVSAFSDLFTLTDLYVAWTRARHRLIVLCQPGELRSHIEAALMDRAP